MLATLRDNQHIYLSNLTQPEEDLVAARFAVIIEGYNRFVDPQQRGGWNGIYRRYDAVKHRLARPFLAELKKLCRERGLPLVVADRRPHWPYQVANPDDIGPDWLPGITLDDHQMRAIRAGCRVECGIFDIPTGGGKTEVAAGLIKAIRCPTVIVAEQLVIIDQLKARLELRDVCEEIGLFYAGKTPTDQLVLIGSIQSLSAPSKIPKPPQESDYRVDVDEFIDATVRDAVEQTQLSEQEVVSLVDMDALYDRAVRDARQRYEKAQARYQSTLKGFRTRRARAKYLQALIQKSEMVMVDECDLAGGNSQYKALFRYWFRGRRRYGFSGTVFDPDKPVDKLFIQEHLGSVVCSVSRRELEDIGRIVPIRYYMLSVGENGSGGDDREEASAFDIAFREKVVESAEFHHTVRTICDNYPNDGTLVLVERDALGYALQKVIPGSVFIHGKTPKRRRDEVLAAFERRDLRVVIGGKIVKRGLDLRGGCENLIIATGGKLWSDFVQKIGRAVRHNERGRSRVFDFYFLNNRYLYDHSRARLRAMVSMGYQSWVIFRDGHKVDGAQFVASRFRRTKRQSAVTSNRRAHGH